MIGKLSFKGRRVHFLRDFREIGDSAAGGLGPGGINEPQHGDLQSMTPADGRDEWLDLLPPRRLKLERRQNAEDLSRPRRQDDAGDARFWFGGLRRPGFPYEVRGSIRESTAGRPGRC